MFKGKKFIKISTYFVLAFFCMGVFIANPVFADGTESDVQTITDTGQTAPTDEGDTEEDVTEPTDSDEEKGENKVPDENTNEDDSDKVSEKTSGVELDGEATVTELDTEAKAEEEGNPENTSTSNLEEFYKTEEGQKKIEIPEGYKFIENDLLDKEGNIIRSYSVEEAQELMEESKGNKAELKILSLNLAVKRASIEIFIFKDENGKKGELVASLDYDDFKNEAWKIDLEKQGDYFIEVAADSYQFKGILENKPSEKKQFTMPAVADFKIISLDFGIKKDNKYKLKFEVGETPENVEIKISDIKELKGLENAVKEEIIKNEYYRLKNGEYGVSVVAELDQNKYYSNASFVVNGKGQVVKLDFFAEEKISIFFNVDKGDSEDPLKEFTLKIDDATDGTIIEEEVQLNQEGSLSLQLPKEAIDNDFYCQPIVDGYKLDEKKYENNKARKGSLNDTKDKVLFEITENDGNNVVVDILLAEISEENKDISLQASLGNKSYQVKNGKEAETVLPIGEYELKLDFADSGKENNKKNFKLKNKDEGIEVSYDGESLEPNLEEFYAYEDGKEFKVKADTEGGLTIKASTNDNFSPKAYFNIRFAKMYELEFKVVDTEGEVLENAKLELKNSEGKEIDIPDASLKLELEEGDYNYEIDLEGYKYFNSNLARTVKLDENLENPVLVVMVPEEEEEKQRLNFYVHDTDPEQTDLTAGAKLILIKDGDTENPLEYDLELDKDYYLEAGDYSYDVELENYLCFEKEADRIFSVDTSEAIRGERIDIPMKKEGTEYIEEVNFFVFEIFNGEESSLLDREGLEIKLTKEGETPEEITVTDSKVYLEAGLYKYEVTLAPYKYKDETAERKIEITEAEDLTEDEKQGISQTVKVELVQDEEAIEQGVKFIVRDASKEEKPSLLGSEGLIIKLNENILVNNAHGVLDLAVEDYTYEVSLEGYEAKEGSFKVVSNKMTEVIVDLEKTKTSSGGSSSKNKSQEMFISEKDKESSGEFRDAEVIVPEDAFKENLNITIQEYSGSRNEPINKDKEKNRSNIYYISKDKPGKILKEYTIKLKYDKKNLKKNETVSMYHWNEEQDRWEELKNVRVDEANSLVIGKTDKFGKFVVRVKNKGEEEIDSLKDLVGHWAEKDIRKIVAEGKVCGYPDGSFRPDQMITRAEFASMIVCSFELPELKGKIFIDTKNHWAQKDISTANGHGVLVGYNDLNFGPNDFISREQVAAMLVNTLKLSGEKSQENYSDLNATSPWARKHLETAISKKLLSGYEDNTIQPLKSTTRAEAVVLINRALNLK